MISAIKSLLFMFNSGLFKLYFKRFLFSFHYELFIDPLRKQALEQVKLPANLHGRFPMHEL